ncbi:hypothetical protein [Nocardia sp. NBC_00511]|uniref:hypothetical protein n=1 Tax=Nocardia sp. NBC_00511 TaxID=2903591 RepID=UPI0030DEB7A3
MRSKCIAALVAATYIFGAAHLAAVASADPDDPSPDPGTSELCPYPDVNNPNCTQFPDDHSNEGDMNNHHDGGDHGHR